MNRLTRRALARWGADQLEADASVDTLARSLSACLFEAGKNSEADMLINDISWELQKRRLLCRSTVTSARPISKETELELKGKLKAITGSREVSINNVIDSRVLGGVKIETADIGWDYTLSSKLMSLKEAFNSVKA